MMLDRTSRHTWEAKAGKSDLLAAAMLTVGMQRLGDDKQRSAVCDTVRSLCQKQLSDGGLPAISGQTTGDPLTTCLLLEAVQRSGVADELPHVLDAGESWLMQQQTPPGHGSRPAGLMPR